ncbi:hypothetical protein GCM10022243_53080 [Saccharothrix violaceirubra]|uniref:Uncharacterized protein n=1 Tax=Saccharothrix violaceirubra TaxID=413306 RepID=A0A7W7SYU9_9PSEU|nr:hypothetical protein [Saccharothrix violaceirubra]MBB4963370.1 hypothetical protein [Saccharothrix violaceirubra]
MLSPLMPGPDPGRHSTAGLAGIPRRLSPDDGLVVGDHGSTDDPLGVPTGEDPAKVVR